MTDFYREFGWVMWAVGLVARIGVGIVVGYTIWGPI